MDATVFLREVGRRLHCDEARAESVTFAVFQELRDRLTTKEAADVAAQLPARLKRMWLEEEHPDRQVRRVHADEFIGRVRKRLTLPDDAEARRGVRAVFAELQRLLGSARGLDGESWDVFSQLPKDLKSLWLTSAEEES